MARQRKKSVRGGGSVFLRKDGRWEAKFKVEETGKYKSLYAGTEGEAYKLLEDAKYQQKQGVLATGPQQTVKQFLEYWLEDVQRPTVRLGTYRNNRIIVYKHLVPALGHIWLQRLTTSQLQSFYAKKLREGVSASRVTQINMVLHRALNHAKRTSLVGVNVSEGVELPKSQEYKPKFLTPEQARLFLQKTKGNDLEALFMLAITTGMRKGEMLGLKWSDIDFEKGTLSICRTVNYMAQHGFVEGPPKTQTSERKILLPRLTIEALQRHYIAQAEKRVRAGSLWVERDIVFCGKYGNFIAFSGFWKRFSRLLVRIGLPHMHFHDLRHSAATLLLSMGVSEKAIQELLGHANGEQTGKYMHVLPSMQKEAVDKMDNLFKE